MMQVAEPSAEDRAQIEASLSEGGPIESALAQATSALSGLSACAGLVLVPKYERVLKQLAFVPLSANQSLVVLVAGDGAVENRVIDIPAGLNPSALVEAGNYISATLRSEEHTSELQSLMRISYAVFRLKKQTINN